MKRSKAGRHGSGNAFRDSRVSPEGKVARYHPASLPAEKPIQTGYVRVVQGKPKKEKD